MEVRQEEPCGLIVAKLLNSTALWRDRSWDNIFLVIRVGGRRFCRRLAWRRANVGLKLGLGMER